MIDLDHKKYLEEQTAYLKRIIELLEKWDTGSFPTPPRWDSEATTYSGETAQVGQFIRIIGGDAPYYSIGDIGNVVSGSDGSVFVNFNHPGNRLYLDGMWHVGHDKYVVIKCTEDTKDFNVVSVNREELERLREIEWMYAELQK